MKIFRMLFLLLILGSLLQSCSKENQKIEVSGTLQQQGITTYQYGTHICGGYALRSNTIDLDLYVGQYVTVKGEKVPGYPVDGGPDYLEVEEVY
ncbi:MAG: hypothetical protein C0592_11985 [Marinilabiliales bacterium]|nr:MAG: hypothetical protein C0592_11985 [Marinilabiliales bacterium]